MLISIVIISYNTSKLTLSCIESAKKFINECISEIIVVDNHSFDDTIRNVKKYHKDVVVIENKDNLGFAKAVNIGVRVAKSEYVAVLNSDIEFFDDSFANLIALLNPKLGIVCPQYLNSDQTWQRSYGNVPSIKQALKDVFLVQFLENLIKSKNFTKEKSNLQKPKTVHYCDGAGFVVNKKNFETLGGFDEKFFFSSEEADFAVRCHKAQLEVKFIPNAYLLHLRGGTSSLVSKEISIKQLINGKIQFLYKHSNVLSIKAFIVLELIYFFELLLISLFYKKEKHIEYFIYAREYLRLLSK